MDANTSGRSVLLAWLGTAATWASLELAQVVIGLIAGLTTIIYTSMKIWDWLVAHRGKCRKSAK